MQNIRTSVGDWCSVFLKLYCIQKLLENGYKVRTTGRSLSKRAGHPPIKDGGA